MGEDLKKIDKNQEKWKVDNKDNYSREKIERDIYIQQTNQTH